MDGSKSAFPTTAKYGFPLNAVYDPAGKWEHLGGGLEVNVEQGPDVSIAWGINQNFEVVHALLAATPEKSAFRSHLLGPFYTMLLEAETLEQEIQVPLVPDDQGSELEQQWAAICTVFESTRITDEAFSLLVQISWLQRDLSDYFEPIWVSEENKEIEGFGDVYQRLRGVADERFGFDEVRGGSERRSLADKIIELGKSVYAYEAGKMILGADDNREIADDVFLLGPKYGSTGIIDHVHRHLGFRWYEMADGLKSAVDEDEPMPRLMMDFGFELKSAPENVGIELRYDRELWGFLQSILPPQSSSRPTFEEVQAILASTVFYESMRQQICTGVGLRCPFGESGRCCNTFREDLQGIYKRSKPWLWKEHWRVPDCFA